MKIERQISPEVREHNQRRLQELHKQQNGVLALDLHGFLMGKNHAQNTNMIGSIADLISTGWHFSGITGYGERIYHDFINPLKNSLKDKGVDPNTAPCTFATRNGALISHLSGEVIRQKPIPPDVFEEITSHELVRAMNDLNRGPVFTNLINERRENIQRGMKLHPQQEQRCWGMRIDYSADTNECYQVTGLWGDWVLDYYNSHPNNRLIRAVRKHCDGTIPATPEAMVPYLRTAFSNMGLELALNTASSHPEIDIAMPGVYKADACKVLAPVWAEYWGCSEEEVAAITIPGGDSPNGNDKGLLEYSPLNAVTNNNDFWDSYTEEGPIILDYPNISDQIDRTAEFLRNVTLLSK